MIMKLSEDDIELLLSRISEQGKKLLAPLEKFDNSYDFYKMYKKIIKLYDKSYQTNLINKTATFQEKFEIVIVAANQSKIPDFQKNFIDSICNIPFDEDNTIFSNELRSDALNITYVAIYCCKFNQFTFSYNLLNYLYENIETIHVEDVEEFYCSIDFLLGYICNIVTAEISYNKIVNIEILKILKKVRNIFSIYFSIYDM